VLDVAGVSLRADAPSSQDFTPGAQIDARIEVADCKLIRRGTGSAAES
jgi:hypothetical protein